MHSATVSSLEKIGFLDDESTKSRNRIAMSHSDDLLDFMDDIYEVSCWETYGGDLSRTWNRALN